MARMSGVCENLGRWAFVPPALVQGQRGDWKLIPKQKLDWFISVISDIFAAFLNFS